jgi:hypothetical protein
VTPGTVRAGGVVYRERMRSVTRHLATALVLLCLQASATVMALRRDPVQRFQGATLSGLVWLACDQRRRLQRPVH